MLDKHDWLYIFSDDHRVYKRGARSAEEIQQAKKQLGEVGERMYQDKLNDIRGAMRYDNIV